MISLLLIACHMLGDYVFQTNDMAQKKLIDTQVRLVHVTIYTLCFLPIVFLWHMVNIHGITFLLAIWVTHYITDCRRWASPVPWPP